MAHPEFQFPFDALFILPLLEHRNTKCKVAVHMESKYISKAVTFLGLFFFHSIFVQFRILAPRARPVYVAARSCNNIFKVFFCAGRRPRESRQSQPQFLQGGDSSYVDLGTSSIGGSVLKITSINLGHRI